MIKSKICTESDFHCEWFKRWVNILGCDDATIHRKTWEWVMIAAALEERGMLMPGKNGIGYAVGKEPLPALFASMGCKIVATDLAALESDAGRLWGERNDVIAAGLEDLWRSSLLDANTFNRLVSYRSVDMTNIPPDLKTGSFDFAWSNCSFEHLGSIRHGLAFILEQMKCLRVGGVAVHTTEFNLSSNEDTLDDKNIVLFRRRDVEELFNELIRRGHHVEELDTSMGFTDADYHVDKYPYTHNPHLRLRVNEWVSTSIILIIRKGEEMW